MLVFNITLPELTPDSFDIVKRELTIKIGDTTPILKEVDASASFTIEDDVFAAKEGTNIEITLVDVDDAGNRSQPATTVTTLVDTITPITPNVPVLTVIAEFPDPIIIVPEQTNVLQPFIPEVV